MKCFSGVGNGEIFLNHNWKRTSHSDFKYPVMHINGRSHDLNIAPEDFNEEMDEEMENKEEEVQQIVINYFCFIINKTISEYHQRLQDAGNHGKSMGLETYSE